MLRLYKSQKSNALFFLGRTFYRWVLYFRYDVLDCILNSLILEILILEILTPEIINSRNK